MLTCPRLDCSYGHRIKQARGPGYVAHLEARLREMEQEVQACRACSNPSSGDDTDASRSRSRQSSSSLPSPDRSQSFPSSSMGARHEPARYSWDGSPANYLPEDTTPKYEQCTLHGGKIADHRDDYQQTYTNTTPPNDQMSMLNSELDPFRSGLFFASNPTLPASANFAFYRQQSAYIAPNLLSG